MKRLVVVLLVVSSLVFGGCTAKQMKFFVTVGTALGAGYIIAKVVDSATGVQERKVVNVPTSTGGHVPVVFKKVKIYTEEREYIGIKWQGPNRELYDRLPRPDELGVYSF